MYVVETVVIVTLDAKPLPKSLCDDPEDPRYQIFCGGSSNDVSASIPSLNNTNTTNSSELCCFEASAFALEEYRKNGTSSVFEFGK